ncbi:universal stress protein [Streptomyces lincolnensis]|uniref:universal stress protein n=1 Tax=Streptomyces lincolnensis TaxID=1915 RepID=UPI001E5FB9F9|nr:universal stress protein [Streptomyces lincolnensis]MCD7442318.1 universal stress protein [Streptomyces lincolnensis]
MSGPVVVGIDGSASSPAVVEAAARAAERLGTGLRLAHALTWSSAQLPPGVPPWDPDGGAARVRVTGPLAEAERRARRTAPGVDVTREVLIGEPVTVLESEARTAVLTVVGGHRVTGLAARLRGSVAGQLAARGRCPVLVVRGRPAPTGPVVLADDTSPAAAGFAFAEAARRGTDLVVLHPRTTTARSWTALRERYPDVLVHGRRVRARTGRALVAASSGAQLVVIEARHRIADALPGAAARTLVDHAHCPVAVIPAEGAGSWTR